MVVEALLRLKVGRVIVHGAAYVEVRGSHPYFLLGDDHNRWRGSRSRNPILCHYRGG